MPYPGAVVLLDGAGCIRTGIGCVHGIAWYARTLGGLLAAGACDDRVPLSEVLGLGIERVGQRARGHLRPRAPGYPGAAVIIARERGDTLEYLVLCDSVLLQLSTGEPRAITDTKLAETVAGRGGPPAWCPARNTMPRGGLANWRTRVTSPAGTGRARGRGPRCRGPRTDRFAAAGLSAVALLSDGASRLADRFPRPQICTSLPRTGRPA